MTLTTGSVGYYDNWLLPLNVTIDKLLFLLQGLFIIDIFINIFEFCALQYKTNIISTFTRNVIHTLI